MALSCASTSVMVGGKANLSRAPSPARRPRASRNKARKLGKRRRRKRFTVTEALRPFLTHNKIPSLTKVLASSICERLQSVSQHKFTLRSHSRTRVFHACSIVMFCPVHFVYEAKVGRTERFFQNVCERVREKRASKKL